MKIVGKSVLENYNFLRKIANSKSEKRRLSLLLNASREELLSLVEVAANILSSNFSLTKLQKERLAPHAGYIRKLARVRTESSARKIVQTGNGVIFASLLLPVITEATKLLIEKISEDN